MLQLINGLQLLAGFLIFGICDADACQQENPVAKSTTFSIGTKIGFVPGDCFFSATLPDFSDSAHSIESVMKDGLLLSYTFPGSRAADMTLPANHGFSTARIIGLADADCRMLIELETVVHGASINLDIAAEPRWLVLGKDFDWAKHRFFVRYNEKWQSVNNNDFPEIPKSAKPGCSVFPNYYQPHVNLADAVLEDWQHGASVKELQVAFPDTITTGRIDGRPQIVEAISIDWKEVVLIGFPGYPYEDIFSRKYDSVFFVCSEKGISRFRWTTQKLEQSVDAVLEWSVRREDIDNGE